MTQDEAVRARAVFLAALRESNPQSPVPDAAVHCIVVAREGGGDERWQVRYLKAGLDCSLETLYRARVIALTSIGYPVGCFSCWVSSQGTSCAAGDCQAEVSA